MWLEVVAASLFGLFAVAIVVQPFFARPGATPPVEIPDFDEVDDTPRGQALSALREIEFDRATGKLSDEDYAFLKARYTQKALAALRAEPVGGGAAGTGPSPGGGSAEAGSVPAGACPICASPVAPGAGFCGGCGGRLVPVACAACGAAPGPEGGWCGSCGARLVSAPIAA